MTGSDTPSEVLPLGRHMFPPPSHFTVYPFICPIVT